MVRPLSADQNHQFNDLALMRETYSSLDHQHHHYIDDNPNPNPNPNSGDETVEFFKTSFGLTVRESAAIMGAHTYGRQSSLPCKE